MTSKVHLKQLESVNHKSKFTSKGEATHRRRITQPLKMDSKSINLYIMSVMVKNVSRCLIERLIWGILPLSKGEGGNIKEERIDTHYTCRTLITEES